METVKQLFEFLKKFNELRSWRQLDIDSFEKVLWFDEIPKEKECYSISNNLNISESSKSHKKKQPGNDLWIKIEKPKKSPCPEPPDEIRPWLKNNVSGYQEQPQLHSYSIQKSAPISEEEINEEQNTKEEKSTTILIEDCPEIKSVFENYLHKKWIPWSQEEKRLEAVSKMYESLYKIYKKTKFQGEDYQIVLGIGLLIDKGKSIKRHIITTPISVNFHNVSGTLTVGPFGDNMELFLEMDMFRESERPKNWGSISSQLSDLNTDFLIKEEFYNCLKSWLNNYDSNGQFCKNFDKNPDPGSGIVLTVSPAVILRKRNEKNYLKFYSNLLEDMENAKDFSRPCLDIIDINKNHPSGTHDSINHPDRSAVVRKHYFPLSVNEEQKRIIQKIVTNDVVVVQGPPGTGKTHSIANLICHFLAEGKKILVTSQTDRALRVLKDKLPEEIKPLCVEILGNDQKSFQELSKTFEAINGKYQNRDNRKSSQTIERLEKKDKDFKGSLVKIESRLFDMKQHETKRYEKLFGFYTGSPAEIVISIKNEEERYKWIKEFNWVGDFDECPIFNSEAGVFLRFIIELKDTEDSVLEEPINFVNQTFTFQQFEEMVKTEKISEKIIKKYKSYGKANKISHYENLTDDDFNKLANLINLLFTEVKSLLNKNEEWIRQSLKDCLSDRSREWKHLRFETNKILDENKKGFLKAEQITEIKITSKIPPTDLYLTNLLKNFFDRYKSNDKIRWNLFYPKVIKDLKKIKINGKKISSNEQVRSFQNYLRSKKALEKINNLWANQSVDTGTQDRNFMRNYYIFKDFLDSLQKCLLVHTLLTDVKDIFVCNRISQPQWSFDSLKEEREITEFIQSKKNLKKIQISFSKIIFFLDSYKNQKNEIAMKIIDSFKNRSLTEYKKTLDQINDFKVKQKKVFFDLSNKKAIE